MEKDNTLDRFDKQREQVEAARHVLHRKIKQLEIQLANKEDTMKNIAGDNNLMAKKY